MPLQLRRAEFPTERRVFGRSTGKAITPPSYAITTMLLKKGIRRCWMQGPMPLTPGGERLIGPAFTLRFVPVREDLATPESWGKPISTRAAIEDMPAGVIAVADAMGVTSAGIFGDILTARMMKRNVTALVTDGAVRDKAGVLASRLPVWCAGVAAPASVNGLTFVGWQEPIACGGCAIFPGDIIVVDDDGAVVIPQNLLEFVAHEGAEHELYESWVVSEVERGAKLPGLYPPNDEAKARYAAWRKQRD
jgi:regulator of RNase E activity RraA